MKNFKFLLVWLVLAITIGGIAYAQPSILDLRNRGFYHDREYFMVRSGRLQYIIQGDRADLGPAVTGYLLDAKNVELNNKVQAYNYNDMNGVSSSALEVVSQKSKFAFTAFGEQARLQWVDQDGIRAVEAAWWANGVFVKERFSGFSDNNTVRRSISLTGANLHGEEQVVLRLRLPAGNAEATNRAIFVTHRGCPQGIVVGGNIPLKMDTVNGVIEIGPITLSPDKTIEVETYMVAQIPDHTLKENSFHKQITRVENDAEELLEATHKWWVKVSTIETEDSLVREVFDITRSVLPAIVSDSGTVRVGPFQYAAEWVRDNSQLSLGLTAAGHFELARAVLEHCIRDLITVKGVTMIGGVFDDPDREQLDQTGELMLALRWYTEFSGDNTLVTTYKDKLITLVERPLNQIFRDATGLIHNRREFWEQTMNDAYELSYNTYVIVGLREAAALAKQLNAEDRKDRWLKEADEIQRTMLKTLVQDGALIKRRSVTGEKAEHLVQVSGAPDTPCQSAEHNLIFPDATMALPMALGLVESGSALATNTLNDIEKLRNQRWWGGGYGRYDASAEINMPGPWGIAGALILKGQHAGGMLDRSRKTLEWFRNVQGGNGGLYYEEMPLIAGSQQNWLGLVTWPTGELPYFMLKYYLGISFESGQLTICPKMFPGSPPVKADLRYRQGRLKIEVTGSGRVHSATVNGKVVKVRSDGSVILPKGIESGIIVLKTK